MLETSTILSWVTKYIDFWLTWEVTLLVTIHYILRRHDLLNNIPLTLLPISAEYTVLQYQLPQRFYIVLASHNTSALCTCRQPEAIIYHQSRLYITSLANALACALHLSTGTSLSMCVPRTRGLYNGSECEYQLRSMVNTTWKHGFTARIPRNLLATHSSR